MTAASRAKTATERAVLAAGYILKGKTRERKFDDCFEMGDGAEVKCLLLDLADNIRATWPEPLTARKGKGE